MKNKHWTYCSLFLDRIIHMWIDVYIYIYIILYICICVEVCMYCVYTYINLASVIQSLRFWTLVVYDELSLQGAAQIQSLLEGNHCQVQN